MKNIIYPITLAISLLFTTSLSAQDETVEVTDFIESLMEDENSKIDYEELEDQYLLVPSERISINTASTEELSKIPFLTELDIYNIVVHRQRYGKFQTPYELKNIPNLDREKIDKILPYISLDLEAEKFSWKKEFSFAKQTFTANYQQVIQTKTGYKPNKSGKIVYEGKPMRYYLKYQYQTSKKVVAGCLLEKDPGEAFWDKKHHQSDYHSAYAQLNDIWKFKRINVGDYKASFGQGLVIGTSTMFGKSTNVTQPLAQREGIYKYTSSNETSALRGGGLTFNHKSLEVSAFVSHRRKDATLADEQITSFKTDGLHRTELEISRKFDIKESVIGGNITFKKSHFQIGATCLFFRYSNLLNPTDATYNYFKLRGIDRHFNIGINYKFTFQRMNLFGEIATDANKGIATLNGIHIRPNSRVSFLAIQRMYQPEYQANFSSAFGENSRTENESGLYIGTKILPMKRITLSAYADVFRFPWEKYTIHQPSYGQEYLVHLLYNTSRKVNMQVKYKYKQYIEQDYCKQTLRYACHWNTKAVQGQSLIEASRATSNGENTHGVVFAQDFFHQWHKPNLSLNLHYAYFWTEAYNNRFYIYERDVLNTFSMPLLYGRGHRIGLNFKWKAKKTFQLYANYSTYIYTDGRTTCGSSYEMIEGNVSSTAKCVMVWKF